MPYLSKDYIITGSLVDLSNPEQAWKDLDKDIRTSIRKGRGMGVFIRPFDGSPEELESVRAFTPNKEDIPLEWLDKHHAYVAIAEDTGERLAWILLVEILGTKKLFMLCHASTQEGKRRQTPNLLIWHAIETWARGPYRYLDIGASYRHSLQTYFSGWRRQGYPMIMRPPELGLDLRITPFDSAAYGFPLGDPNRGRQRFAEKVGTDDFTAFPRALFAIEACLCELQLEGRLSSESEVCITTTTDTPYISSHVTRPIEAVCGWSRTPSEKTAAVFLIHEFGFPHPEVEDWRRFCDERHIPLIEDLAYAWGTAGTGLWGDYRIYSATKALSVPFGGFLVGRRISQDRLWDVHGSSDLQKEEQVLSLIDTWWQPGDEIRAQRQKIWKRYEQNLDSVSDPFMALSLEVMPGAYLAKMKDEEEMKRVSAFVRRFGIEVGNWYHHAAIFLPCHQRMQDRHVDYICGAILACYREGCGVPSSDR